MEEPTTVYQGEQTNLPPGYAHQEQMKANADNLAEKAETIADAHDVNAINPDSIKVEREILHIIDACEVTHQQPGYKYKWVQDQWPSHAKSLEVRRTRSIHVSVNGKTRPAWEIVLHDMPESPELKQVDGTRRVGDCILMRCEVAIYMLLQIEEAKKRARQMGSVTQNFDDLAASVGMKTAHGNFERVDIMNQIQAKNLAKDQLHNMVRDGNIPGMQMPDNRR